MDDVYYSIKSPSTGFFSDKGSKFHAFAFPVNNQDKIKDILHQLKKEYHDARHHVYAYMLGPDYADFRANDDGEPSNSSGMPVLGQIRSNNLTDILIVVVRYFGGTKLGVPGLINAYKTAAADAISNSVIVEKNVNHVFELQFDYAELSFVERVISELNIDVVSRDFTDACRMKCSIRLSDKEKSAQLFAKNYKIKVL
jgi:uncharacterized YigZ family protein